MSNKRIGIILDVDAEVSKAKGNIGSLSKVFDGIGGKQGNQLRDILADINTEYSKLADESGKAMSKIGDFSKAEKALQKLDQLFGKLEKELGNIDKMSDSDLSKLFPPEVADRIKKASEAIKTYNTYVEESSKTKGAIGQATKQYEDQEKAVRKAAQALKELEDIQRGASKKQVVSADTKALKANEVKAAVAELNQYEKELVEAQSKMDEFKKRKADLFTRGTQNKSSEFRQLNQDLDAAQRNFDDATNKAGELKRELKNMVIQGDLDNDIKDAEKALENAQDAAEELKKNLESVKATEFSKAFDEAKKKLEALSDVDLSNVVKIDDLNELFKRFSEEGVEGVKKGVTEMKQKMEELGNVNKETGDKIDGLNQDLKQQNEAFSEIQGIKNRVLEFFSLNNAMQLAQRAMQQTFQTIKELDAAMTETAVVTDFSVGDMWDALPRYTKAANELGTTTLGAYETMTLFYQQGLNTNEAFEIGTETMKMARIAGLDYAEATNLMTAALRGFNMELNETSAQRINDVYSELAAITAADTEEIATAMTKTASIAKSANMEFETTAAFLSQIIETTREPAETAGTAMKTIIARFTEMKKAASDVINFEGEEINVNKVEEALRSAGVALRDINGEFRDTDDVFLELASKWNNLDIMTQRYIATMAAGSRQQSRFLAMMQDYDRTMELVDAAYSSSGASQAQFLKTQDSLESKLNKLKNAWNEFLMGITNSKAIKVGVDLLTGLLDAINKLTGNSGLGKIGVALGTLFGGKMISNKLFGGVKESIITSLLKPLGDAGVLADGVASKLSGLGKGSWWKQMTSGMTGFKTAIAGVGSSLATILPILIAIAAVAGTIAAVEYFSEAAVATRQLEQAEKEANSLAQGLEDARRAVQAIGDSRSGLQTLKDDLADLVVGTDEWKQKLMEVRLEESRLISKYGLQETMTNPYTEEEQSGLIKTNSDGSQSITDKGWDFLEEQKSQAVTRSLAASNIGEAQKERQEFDTNKIITLENTADEAIGSADEVVGTLTGMATTAATVAAAMMIIPEPITTLAGTALLAAASISAGYVAGKATEEFVEDEHGRHTSIYKDTKTDLEQEQEMANNQQYMRYKDTFITDIQGNDAYNSFSDEKVNAIASMSAKQLNSQIDIEREKIGEELSDADLEKWAIAKGYDYKNGKVYDIDGKEVGTTDRKTMANDLAVYNAYGVFEKDIPQLAKYIDEGGAAIVKATQDTEKASADDFTKIFNGDISTDEALINSLVNDPTQISAMASSLMTSFGTDAEKALAMLTGKTAAEIAAGGDLTTQLETFLSSKVSETQANQNQTKTDFFEEIAKSGIVLNHGTLEAVDGITYTVNGKEGQAFEFTNGFNATNALGGMIEENGEIKAAQGVFDQLNASQRQSIVDISESLRKSFGSAGIGGQTLFENLSHMGLDDIQNTISYFEGVDFSNPIKGAAAFRDALNDIGDNNESPVKGLVEDLQKVSQNEYDLGSQFDYLYSSGVFENLSEPIAELIEENGKLTADNVLELADASEDLALFLENDKISADGLATALTMVATQGPSAMQGITSATLAAISSTQTLSTTYEKMIASIEGFKPAIDTMSGIDFTNQSLEKMKEMIDSGEYGNTQLQSYLKYFYGNNAGKTQGDIDKQYQDLVKWSKNEGRNFWTEAQTKGVLGTGDTFSTTFKTGNLQTMNVDASLTTEQALANIQKEMGITKEAATNYLAVLTSHSVELSELLNSNDAAAAAQTLFDERMAQLQQDGENGADAAVAAFGDAEVQLLAEKYGQTVDAIKEQIINAAGEGTSVVFTPSFVDENGQPLTGQALIDKLNSQIEGDTSENKVIQDIVVTTKVTDENGKEVDTIDYLETKELMLDVGLNEEQANQAINHFIETYKNPEGEEFKISANGEIIPEAVTAEQANEWASTAVEQVEPSTVQTFADTLANIGYTEVGQKIFEDVNGVLKQKEFTVNLTPNTAGLKTKIQASVNSGGRSSSGTWYIGFYKDGSDGIPKDQLGMTGEEGTELIQSEDGTARLVGTNGPELTSLKKGDVIYTAEETKKILKGNSQQSFNRYAKGTNPSKKKTTNTDLLENIEEKLEALDRKKKNGKISDSDYQSQKKVLLNEQHTAIGAELKKLITESKGVFYHDKNTDTIQYNKDKYNKLKDDEKEEIKKIYEEAVQFNKSQNNIEDELASFKKDNSKNTEIKLKNNQEKLDTLEQKKENGEVNYSSYRKSRISLLETRDDLLEADYNKKLAGTKQVLYEDKKGNLQYDLKKYNKLTKEEKEDMDKIFEDLSSIKKERKDISAELKSYAEDSTKTASGVTVNSFNEQRKLEQLEKKYENGEITAGRYEQRKREELSDWYNKAWTEFEAEYNNSEYKKYFKYNKETGSFKLNETKYSGLDKDMQAKVDEEGERLSGLFDTTVDIKDQIDDLEPGDFGNSTFNEEETLKALERNLNAEKIGAKEYSQQRKSTLESQKADLKSQRNEALKSKNMKQYAEFDKELGAILVKEEELAKLSEEEQKKVLDEIQAVQQINDELKGIDAEIKAAKKALRYDTQNEEGTQDTLDRKYANGDIDGKTYQDQKKAANNAEIRKVKAENNAILRELPEGDIGKVYYDTISQSYKINDLYEFASDKEKAAAQAEANKLTKQLGDILAMSKDDPERAKKLTQFRKDWNNSGYSGVYYLDEYGELRKDAMTYRFLDPDAAKKVDEKIATFNGNRVTIDDNKEEIKDLTARKNAELYDTKPFERALEELERKYKNKEISFSEYRKGRDEQLLKQREALMREYDYQAKSKENKNLAKYVEFEYDDSGVIVGIKGVKDAYYDLAEQQQQDVDEFMRIFDDISETVDSIDETVGDSEFKDPQDRADYNEAEAALWNNQNEQYQLEEDREELTQLQGLVNKLPLPEELKTMTNMGFTAAEMGYEAQEIMNLRSEYENLDKVRGLREERMDYIGTREQVADANSNAMYYYDENTRSYVIDEEKARGLDDEEYYKMKDEVEELDNEFASKLRQISSELNGGIIQDATKTLGRTLTGLSKAFDSTGDTTDNVKDALNEMENALGLSTNALDKFEADLTNAIKKSGLDKKTFKGLGILNEEQNKKMQDFFDNKIGGGVEGSSKIGDFLGMILGSGETNGLDFAQSFLGSMGEGFDFISGFMNFDMLNLGMDMFTQGIGLGQQIFDKIKSGIEKAKQMIEQVIQYIAQATQVLVDAWTNREDYLYNFLKVIEKHLQEYERLQRYSTQIQKGRIASADDIAKNWEDQWASLQKQLEEQTERLETRQQELDRSRWNPFMLISGWDPLSDTLYENREVKMLWDIIIGLGEAFAPLGTGTFFSQLNQLYEDYDQRVQQSYEDRLAAEQALLDIEDERLELVKVGADETTQFEDKVLQALIQKEQEAIDELSRLNDAVTTANQKLMSTLQDNLSKIRQDRENEKKEEELGEKERRLAYLRQDTSGANAMEIKRLEKELDEQHEDYTDTLIDQKISELEKQNELAAEQRQQQIDLLQGQLDYAEKYGLYWETIYDMLYSIDENGKVVINADNFDVDGNIRENSQLAQLLGTHSDRMGMSTWQSVLDNEETKLLGLYYKAFMTRNGADGNWADYWALLDPGANDPDYTRQMAEIPGGLRGVLSRLEIGIREYFGTSNPGLVNMGRSAEQGLKNFFGKLFNYEPWETFKAEEFNKAYVEADTMNAIHRMEVGIVNSVKDGFNNFFGLNQKAAQTGRQTTEKAKSNNNNYGTQNYGAVTENYNFNIGTVGENISLDDMVDRVTSAIKGLFTGNINAYKKSH